VLEEDATHELVAVEASRAVVRQHADLQCLWRIVEPNDAGLCDGDAEDLAGEILRHGLVA